MTEMDHKRWTLATAGVLVSWCLTVLGIVWATASDRQALHSQVQDVTGHIADHETRLRSMEARQNEMAADVKWIRQALERQERGHEPQGPSLK